jgi:N-acetylglucosamine-6-phosphate deacetylase
MIFAHSGGDVGGQDQQQGPFTITGRDPATNQGIAVTIENGLIVAIRDCDVPPPSFLSAGLVDLQVNGFGGIDLNDGDLSAERVVALASLLLQRGVTCFLPTLITAAEETIIAGLRAIALARAADPLIAHLIPFAHVEGPFIAPENGPRGAHPVAHVRPPDLAEFARWQHASGGLVGMITLSPHYPGAPAFIQAVRAEGVHVAIGHTDAAPEAITAAIDAGARLATHLGNGVAATLPRHPNLIWTQLADDRLTASFIADGHHLPADVFRAMLRAKGVERSVLVSDSVALGGMPRGQYDQAIGGRVELRADGRLGVVGTPYLAGAARPLCDDVALAVRMARIPLADVLSMATRNAGHFVGGRGLLQPGAPADLIRFSWREDATTLEIEAVWVRGRSCL